MWFETLTGFQEESPEQVRENIAVDGELSNADDLEREKLRNLLRIGCQWNTEVTLSHEPLNVTQVYCSALPVRYSTHAPELWASFRSSC